MMLHPAARLLETIIKPFVEGTAQPGLNLFAKALAVILHQMCVVGRPVPPDLYDAEMIGAHDVLKKLEAHGTGVFGAIGRELLQRFYGDVHEVREYVHVSDDVQSTGFGWRFLLGRKRDTQQQAQKRSNGTGNDEFRSFSNH